MFGTHYCGPGGAGSPVNALDVACQLLSAWRAAVLAVWQQSICLADVQQAVAAAADVGDAEQR